MQALKLASSQAILRWHCRWTINLLACLGVLSFAACNAANNDSGITADAIGTNSLQAIDLGVLFSNESFYYCVTLQHLGLPANTSVERIESSCGCIVPQSVKVKSNQGAVEALRIAYHPTDNGSSTDVCPNMLAVEIKLFLYGGQQWDLILRFLETRRTDWQTDGFAASAHASGLQP